MNPQTVLYIDPDADSREIHRVLLDALGYRPVCAATEEQGLRLARSGRPGVVITELFRPPPGGFSFVERLVRERGGLPVIVLSAYAFSEDRASAARAGAAAFLAKPCPAATIEAVLARCG